MDNSLIDYIKKYSNSRAMHTIVVHCSATKENKDYTSADIKKWHLERGFNDIGYHFIIRLDGTIEIGRQLDKIGAHVSGNNTGTIGICYIGGLNSNGKSKDTTTDKQKESLKNLINLLRGLTNAKKVLGHRDYSKDLNNNGIVEPSEFMKDCPCFDVKKEFNQ